MAKPTCMLCSGALVCLEKVHVTRSDGALSDYYLAWVCTMCSAAFPIAVQPKFFGGAKPLFVDGREND
jgi:hypothetical protein